MAAFNTTNTATNREFAPSSVLNQATELDLEYCSQMVLLAGRYLEKGKIEAAEASLRRGLARVPDNPECTAHLAVCLAAGKRKYVTAEKLIKNILENNPYDPTAWYALGRINLLGGRRKLAFQNFEEAKRISCADAEIETKVDELDPRRGPVLKILPRNHFLNVWLGMLRAQFSK